MSTKMTTAQICNICGKADQSIMLSKGITKHTVNILTHLIVPSHVFCDTKTIYFNPKLPTVTLTKKKGFRILR